LKIKTLNGILIIDILSFLLFLSIVLIPSTLFRVLLGLPFILFFPGYTLIAALFINKEGMNSVERFGLSCCMSITVTSLVSFGLNYTSWGIRLEPVLYSTTIFIFITSIIALFRRFRVLKTRKFTAEIILSLPDLTSDSTKRVLSIILIAVILADIGVIGYMTAVPQVGERFTEFYVLGINGKVGDYPIEYFMNTKMVVTEVIYGDGIMDTNRGLGTITLGIVNNEQKLSVYSIQVIIDGEVLDETDILGPITLKQGEKWQKEIGIVPNHLGDNQKVDLLLFRDTGTTVKNSLSFWINVKQN
jgi:uncharacterized membrane protein